MKNSVSSEERNKNSSYFPSLWCNQSRPELAESQDSERLEVKSFAEIFRKGKFALTWGAMSQVKDNHDVDE